MDIIRKTRGSRMIKNQNNEISLYVKNESSITYHSKPMANVKVFANKQMDRQTNRLAKNYMPPIYGCWSIKIWSPVLAYHVNQLRAKSKKTLLFV